MGFYDFSAPTNFDYEFRRRFIYPNAGAGTLNITKKPFEISESQRNYKTFIEAALSIKGDLNTDSSQPFGYYHTYPSLFIGDETNSNLNSVDDPPGSVKTPIIFNFWNRYRGDGTGWQISFGRSIQSSVRQQFFADYANGEHNRSRFITRAYDQSLFNENNQQTWIHKDHATLNLWGSGFVSVGEEFNMAIDGANNGIASDLNKPTYHFSAQNGIGSGNGSVFTARLSITATTYDTARNRHTARFQDPTGTKPITITTLGNLHFGTNAQYIVMVDATTGVAKKARINNNVWEISNF